MPLSSRPRTPEDFDAIWAEGPPPWEIGRAQPALAEVLAGGVEEPVLDLGCGTGEHALTAAAAGLEAVGVDSAEEAIAQARERALRRGLPVRFVAGDALDPAVVGEGYGTVLDSGFFHVLEDPRRARYAATVREALRPGGLLWVLCFTPALPGDAGPRRVSPEELRATFAGGFSEQAIAPAQFIAMSGMGVPSWLASFRRR